MSNLLAKFRSRAICKLPSISLVVLALCLSVYSVQSFAQRAEDNDRKTKTTAAMSEAVYKKLSKAQETIEAKKYDEGLAMLRDLLKERHLSSYEKAQIYNFFAYTYFTLERYKDAIKAYQNVLAQPDLPEALVMNSTYTLAQLYFIQEEYTKAIDLMKRWFGMTEKPTVNAYMILAQAYYQLENYKASLEPLKKAYAMVKERGEQPKENLLLLLRVDYYNLGDFPNMLKVLHELVTLYPKPEYWMTMGQTYSEMKQQKKQMSIFEMLYEHGDLTSGNQQLNLANLYLLYDVPYKAAKVLDKGIKSGVIDDKVRNLRLLAQAWYQADESAKAIGPMRKAAEQSKDGEMDVRLAQAYINLDRYKEAVDALHEGFKKGNIKRADSAYIMLGMAEFEMKNYNSALNAFHQAEKDKRSAKSAKSWIKYVESEQDRNKQLEESLKQRRSS